MITSFVGFVTQFSVARHLGTERAGLVGGAEALAIMLLALVSFGVDSYALQELAVRPERAKSFVSGIVAFRAATASVLVLLGALCLGLVGRSRLGIELFLLFGVSSFLGQTNDFLSASLKAVGSIGSLPRISLGSKLFWAGVIVSGLIAGVGPIAVPLGWVLGELMKCVLLSSQVRSHLGVQWRVRGQEVRGVLQASLPLTASVLVAVFAGYFDLTLMSFVQSEREVGLYRFAQQFSSVAILLGTVLPWVILPLASRAYERSSEEYLVVVRRSLQFVITLAIPVGVLVALNADTVVAVMGPEWRPAIPALRILGLCLAITYAVILGFMFLQVEGRERTWKAVRRTTVALLSGMAVNFAFLRLGPRWFGVGGAGTFAALVVVAVEVGTCALLFQLIGRKAFDRRVLRAGLFTGLAAVSTTVVDRLIVGRVPGVVRMVVDVGVMVAALWSWGAFTSGEFRSVLHLRQTGVVHGG